MKIFLLSFCFIITLLQSSVSFAQSCSSNLDRGYDWDVTGMDYLDKAKTAKGRAGKESRRANPSDGFICSELEVALDSIYEARDAFQHSRNSYRKAYAVCAGEYEDAAKTRMNQSHKNIELQKQLIEDLENVLDAEC